MTTRSGRISRPNRRYYNDSMTNGLVTNKVKYASANMKLSTLNSCFLHCLEWIIDATEPSYPSAFSTWDQLLHDVKRNPHFNTNSLECIHPGFLSTKANKDDNPTGTRP